MYPEWVEKHRTNGTNISVIKGRYYLYKVTSVWNKEKKRAQKITKGYLGRITEDGLIPPKSKKEKICTPVTVKEFGATEVISQLGDDIFLRLKEFFPKDAEIIYTLAVLRLIEHCPFKRVEHLYKHSFLSEMFKGLNLSSKDLSLFLKNFGDNREQIVNFMRSFISGNEHILFDGTSIISKSEKMDINRVGYNAHRQYDPQINLLYAFACESRTPVYYRIIAGNLRDVSAFKLSLNETKLQNMSVIADKGFGSSANFQLLEESGIDYIVPLRRNSTTYDSSKLETGNKASFDGYFMFNERPIWYYKSNDTIVYLDNDLKTQEEKDYLMRIEKNIEGFSSESFIERQFKFGTIILKTNILKNPQDIYNLYKERGEIEQSFDFLKNLLEHDKSYMQNEKSLESWAFINHISLMLNYKVYNILRDKKLLSKFSVSDFFSHFKYIFKIKSDSGWITSEISAKSNKILKELDLHIT